MCGIAGLLDLRLNNPPQRATLERMAASIAHRGPDDDGFFIAPPVGLAVRRLSIVDIAGGHMPLANEDQSVWIVHNGEVYNAPTLRDELRARGHTFRTRGDTEVIVHAYEEWGDECIARLRGMFAIALWDAQRQRLLLARDRFGVKPLYYAQRDGAFAFGSEIMPTLLGAGLARVADCESLRHVFAMGYVPSPRTMFCGVQSLPPAHWMVVDATGAGQPQPYWDIHFPRDGEHARLTHHEATEKFSALLRESVKMRLMSDVPIGALLSGGLDSSSLVALLQELSGGRTHTFSIGFEADTHDETRYAKRASDFLQTEHHTLTFGLRDFDWWPQVIRHMESPQLSATSIPIYLLYRACHTADFKVILTGEGADELLGGYHWFAGDARLQPWLNLPQPLRARIAALPFGSAAGRRVLAHGTPDPIERFALWGQATTDDERAALQLPTPNVERSTFNVQLPTSNLSSLHPLDQFLYLESHTRLPSFINDEVDRMSMAHSVEARVPFLDHKLWEFTATLPPHFKLRGGMDKRLLRAAMKGKLPDAIRLRRKQGLAAPHALFWQQTQLPAFVRDAIADDALRATGYFAPAGVAQLLREHQASRADHSRALTGVLTTQLWHHMFQVTSDR
ncbi:MAG: asparagine synthase (glutamine-hydrolyzing) [Chloroflexota bacterium]